MVEVRRKETICATVSPYIKKQIDELVKANEFSSASDFMSIAASHFLEEYKLEKKMKKEQEAHEQKVQNGGVPLLTRPVTIE